MPWSVVQFAVAHDLIHVHQECLARHVPATHDEFSKADEWDVMLPQLTKYNGGSQLGSAVLPVTLAMI